MPSIIYPARQSPPYQPSAVTVPSFDWYRELNHPMRVREPLTRGAYAALTSLGLPIPGTETITVDKWWSDLRSVPSRRAMPAADQPVGGAPPPVTSATGTGDPAAAGWPGAWAPPQFMWRIIYPARQGPPVVTSGLPEVITVDKWWSDLRPPVQVRPPLPRGTVPYEANLRSPLPSPEIITADKWWRDLERPVWARARLPVGATPDLASLGLPIPNIVVPVTWGWYADLMMPLREDVGLSVGAIGFMQMAAQLSEIITMDKWWQPFGEPTRRPPFRLTDGIVGSTLPITGAEVITLDKWYHDLRQPLRLPLRLPVGAMPDLASLGLPIVAAEIITLDKWWHDLRGPVRGKAPLPVGAIPSLTSLGLPIVAAETVTMDKWWHDLRPPYLTRRSLGMWLMPDFFIDTKAFLAGEQILADKWLRAFNEPVRVKEGLRAGLQQALASLGLPIPQAEIITMDKWWADLRPPYLPARGILAALQRAFEIDAKVLTLPDSGQFFGWHAPLGTPTWLHELPPAMRQAIAELDWVVPPATILMPTGTWSALYLADYVATLWPGGFYTVQATDQPTILDPRQPQTYTWDFGPHLAQSYLAGVTIQGIVATAVTLRSGVDPNFASRLTGTPTLVPSPRTLIANTAVAQIFGPSVDGCVYLLECQIQLSNGDAPVLVRALPVALPA